MNILLVFLCLFRDLQVDAGAWMDGNVSIPRAQRISLHCIPKTKLFSHFLQIAINTLGKWHKRSLLCILHQFHPLPCPHPIQDEDEDNETKKSQNDELLTHELKIGIKIYCLFLTTTLLVRFVGASILAHGI